MRKKSDLLKTIKRSPVYFQILITVHSENQDIVSSFLRCTSSLLYGISIPFLSNSCLNFSRKMNLVSQYVSWLTQHLVSSVTQESSRDLTTTSIPLSFMTDGYSEIISRSISLALVTSLPYEIPTLISSLLIPSAPTLTMLEF